MYTIIDSLLPQFPVSINSACSCLNISRSQYYDWKIRNDSLNQSDPFEIQIKDKIHQIAIEFPRYGYRRITKELHRRGLQINSKRVLNLMHEDNLLCIKKIFVPRTTDSNHNHKIYPNLVRDIEVTRINQLWVSDITYIQLPNEFIYLAVITDIGSRRCIGWDLDRNIDTQLTLNALYKALECRAGQDLNDLIHHSDQGVQYASNAYIECLKEHDICISMSRKGNPYDNAFAESFMKTLKYEEVYLADYRTFNEAYGNIENFIESVYNEKRLHSKIGYLPPIEYEEALSLYSVA
ncbi:MAG: transposase [Candidatus Methanomarinus sp.]|nr:MAG: transposase [ANME-2 cluster archaeon]